MTVAASPPLAVLFDVDGVLIDSYQPHFESWRQVAAEYGVDYTEAQFAQGFGMTSRAIIAEQWAAQWSGPPLTDETIHRIAAEKEAAYRDLVADDFPAMPGATDLVRSLAEAGFLIAVGSSGPPENVELAIEKLGIARYLGGHVTGRDVAHGKPDPDIFLKAAGKLAVPPARCVVVEDAPTGVAAAKAAGMLCVGFPSTGRTRSDVAGADLVINSLADLSPEVFWGLLGT